MEFGTRWLLRKMKIHPNAYYNYKKNRKSAYLEQKKIIQEKMLQIYHEYSGNPSYRMMQIYLRRAGITLSHTTVLKYMQELKIKSTVMPRKPSYKKGECYKRFSNIINREFDASRPNEKWCTDFTYLFMDDGRKRYNCSIIDLYDKSAVATMNSNHIDATLAIKTLELALKKNNYPENILLHSDQGSQYTSQAFTEFCEMHNIKQSMSKSGCPYDNSPMDILLHTKNAMQNSIMLPD